MSTITTILSTDNVGDSRAVINTNFSNLNTDKIEAASADTLTNKTIDADNNTISNLALGAEVTGASTDLTDTANIALLNGTNSWSSLQTFNANALVSGTLPIYRMTDTNGGTNETNWMIWLQSGNLTFSTATDAAPTTNANNAITINRTGTTIDEIQLDATALDFNGTLDVSGEAKFNNNIDLGGTGLIETFTAATGGVSAGNLCYLNGSGEMATADASAESTADTVIAIALENISAASTGSFLLFGTYTTTGLTAGANYYVSETAAAITATAPTTSGAVVRIVGTAISTTKLLFNPSTSYIVLA